MLATKATTPRIRALAAIACAGIVTGIPAGCATKTTETTTSHDETQALLDEYGNQLPSNHNVRVSTGELRANINPVTTAVGEIILDTDRETLAESLKTRGRTRALPTSTANLDEQIETSATQLAVMLARRAKNDEFGVGFGDLARMATLDAIVPGLFNTYFLDASVGTTLTEAQRETLTLWRAFAIDTISEMEDALDEEQLALYREIRKREKLWRKWAQLTVSDVALCTAVYGYGNYDAMNTDEQGHYRLIAGRRYRSVIYVEVEGFTNNPAVREGTQGFETSVALSMSLYQHQNSESDDDRKDEATGDLLTWKTSEESVKDFSRNQRHDFFLVQTIELPETLSTGRYTLKVRVRDLASDHQTEKIVPIDIVSIRSTTNKINR